MGDVDPNRYCFCLKEDDDETELSLPFFPLSCRHAFHRNCLRQMLRSAWKQQSRKMVDERGLRVVADMPCPLCRRPLSDREVADLQTQKQILYFNTEFPESDEQAVYAVYVKKDAERPGEPESTLSERYRAGNLPEFRIEGAANAPSTTKRLLITDFEVTSTSPSSVFKVSVQREEPTFEMIQEFEAKSGELPSLEDDAEEERAQENYITLLRRQGEARVPGGEDGARHTILLADEAFSPPLSPHLPVIEEVYEFRPSSAHPPPPPSPPPLADPRTTIPVPIRRPPTSATTQTRVGTTPRGGGGGVLPPSRRILPTAVVAPSVFDRPRPPNTAGVASGKERVQCRRPQASDEEKAAKKRRRLFRSEKTALDKIKGNIKNTQKTVRTLYNNIRAWRSLREETRSSASASTSLEEADRGGSSRWSIDCDLMVERTVSLCGIINLFGDLFEEDQA